MILHLKKKKKNCVCVWDFVPYLSTNKQTYCWHKHLCSACFRQHGLRISSIPDKGWFSVSWAATELQSFSSARPRAATHWQFEVSFLIIFSFLLFLPLYQGSHLLRFFFACSKHTCLALGRPKTNFVFTQYFLYFLIYLAIKFNPKWTNRVHFQGICNPNLFL